MVKDGRLVFAKGYGEADREQGRPVIADRTVFRFGSVGKLFTWTAVMQLVEQGRLDLHADVNTYLEDFKVPATYPRPITLAHLMTHTAGFENRRFGLVARTAADLQPLGPYLARDLPARVRPPGELVAYSNDGAALAGYIVEQVSGLPFEQYVEAHILQPLGMHRSTFRQPLPPDLAADLAVGYTHVGGTLRAEPFEHLHITPAGSLSGTVTDLAPFIIAHLQHGRYEQTRILQEATAEDMHRRHFAHDPRVSGWTYGFKELHRNNQRILWHGGDTSVFHGALMLLPEQQVGLAVSYNGAAAGEAYRQLMYAFLDRYFPMPPAATVPPTPLADFGQRAQRVTGSYLGTRSAYTNFLKLENLFRHASVRATADGQLVTEGVGFDAAPRRWVEVEPLAFREVDGQESLVFHTDCPGGATRLFVGNFPVWAFEKLAWYESVPFQVGWLAGCLLLFLSALLVWPLQGLVSRWHGAAKYPRPVRPHLARWLALALSGLNVLFLIGFAVWYFGFYDLPYDVPPPVVAWLVIPLLTTSLAAGLIVCTLLAWRESYWSLAGRLHYTLVTLGALAFVWWLNYWNLLGFRF